MRNFVAKVKNKLFTKRLMKKFDFYVSSFNDSQAVIMFHNISNQSGEEKFVSNLNSFKEFILFINKKIGFIKPDELFASKKGVLLTFDDVYESVFKDVFPFLKQENIPFLIFVATKHLSDDGYINKNMLLELSKSPLCYVGAHSINHPKLRFDKNSKNEVTGSIIELESIIDRKIDYFAYPYGSIYACSRKNIIEAKNSGVKYAFSAIPGYLNNYAKKHKYFLPRFNGDSLIKQFQDRGLQL